MADHIKLLPDSVANQIAAGEVVNRPASVVKELMENAVDAGAGAVTLNFRDGGRDLIQIKDDGRGMSPQDARMAFERHATSKIASVDDIYALMTFGFRGEALASIAAVAQVEMHTRTEAQEIGTQVIIDGGTFRDQGPVAAPKGTQIWIRNLFYNVPARKKFLDKGSTESAHILTEFQRVMLAHPEIAFQLFRDDAPVYNLPAGGLHQRVVGILGKGSATKLLEVGVETTIARVKGFVGKPEAARQRTREQFLFVNGRFFKSAFFHKAILSAYEKLIPTTTQIPYFLYIEIDPEQIDVNVHPQKTEVKFSNQGAVWQIINAAVRETLAKNGAVPMMDFDSEERLEIPPLTDFKYEMPLREPSVVRSPDYNPFGNHQNTDIEYISPEREDPTHEPAPQTRFAEIDSVLNRFEHVTPLGDGLAAAVWGTRFVAIDLRRAREAVLFERLHKAITSGHSASQQLLFPERMALGAEDAGLARDHVDEFAALGFDIRPAGEHSIEIAGVPPDVTVDGIDEVVYEILDTLRDGVFEGDTHRRQRLAAAMARAGASAAKVTRMTPAEVETLLGALAEAGSPNFTPGGKAVMTEITPEEIRQKLK